MFEIASPVTRMSTETNVITNETSSRAAELDIVDADNNTERQSVASSFTKTPKTSHVKRASKSGLFSLGSLHNKSHTHESSSQNLNEVTFNDIDNFDGSDNKSGTGRNNNNNGQLLSPTKNYLPAILKSSSSLGNATTAIAGDHQPPVTPQRNSSIVEIDTRNLPLDSGGGSSSWHFKRRSGSNRQLQQQKDNSGGTAGGGNLMPSSLSPVVPSSSHSTAMTGTDRGFRSSGLGGGEFDLLTLTTTSAHTRGSLQSSLNSGIDIFSEHDIVDSVPFRARSSVATVPDSLQEVPSEEPLDSEAHYTALNFAMEHRIFLNAALALLAERDRQAPELGMKDPIVLKSGSLKKASHLMNGVWKVKFVEIRRGMFSYYENVVQKDASGEDELLRKDIPLEANSCSCRAVKLHEKAFNLTPGGSIFELSVNGSKRLWMAKTRADRHLWMQTIQNAMVGGSVTRGNTIADTSSGTSPRSPFKVDLRKYMKAQSAMRNAKTRNDYVLALKAIADNALHVPVKWIAKQQGDAESGDGLQNTAFREGSVDTSVEQLWKDLLRDSVTINGENFRGDSGHGPEKIIGALLRAMLGVGHETEHIECNITRVRSDLPESQALSYARDILLSGNRTRSGGDSYYCVNTLCKNEDLVVVVPASGEVEPVMIDVREDESDLAFYSRVLEKTGWIKTRNKTQKQWRSLFFVLSDGTLSFYENALPRPHRLQGQMVLTDIAVSIARAEEQKIDKDGKIIRPRFILTLAKEGVMRERQMLFDSADRLLDWTYALECTFKIKALSERKPHRRRSSFHRDLPEMPNSRGEILSLADKATKEHVRKLGLDESIVENRLSLYSRKKESAVLVSIRACTAYEVCTLDPQGDEREDTWATIRSYFMQSFRIYGGPNGRIMRGEEIVRLCIMDCVDAVPESLEQGDESPRRTRTRLIFRSSSTGEEVGADADGIKATSVPPLG